MYIGSDGREYQDAELDTMRRDGADDLRQELEQATRQATFAYYLQLVTLIHNATRDQEYTDLGGQDGVPSLYCLQKALQRALAEVRMLRRHRCQWNENDCCDICGRDGRA